MTKTKQVAPVQEGGVEVCIRCDDPVNMTINDKRTPICFDCYTLLLDNGYIPEGGFWALTVEDIHRAFDEMNTKLKGIKFDI